MADTMASLRKKLAEANARIQELETEIAECASISTTNESPDHTKVVISLENRHADYLEMYRLSSCQMRRIDPAGDGWPLAKEIELLIAKQFATDPLRSLMEPGSATGPAGQFNKVGGGW